MKKAIILICILLPLVISAQINPTLGVGLEQLTLNKGKIDVEVLTQIIMEKQKQLKNEALKRFMLKMFPDNNYATRYYIQNSLQILLNEKNPQVIEKEILELTTNYALALGIAAVYFNIDKIPNADGVSLSLVQNVKIDQVYNNYGKFVDIVSLSLSNCEKIRNKGFYKNRVDYTLKSSIDVNSSAKELTLHITKQIGNYTENYEIIKEFFSKNKEKKVDDIAVELINDYRDEIAQLLKQDLIDELIKALSTNNARNFDGQFSSKITMYLSTSTGYAAKQKEVQNLDIKLESVATMDNAAKKYLEVQKQLDKISTKQRAFEAKYPGITNSKLPEVMDTLEKNEILQLQEQSSKLGLELKQNRDVYKTIVSALQLDTFPAIDEYVSDQNLLDKIKRDIENKSTARGDLLTAKKSLAESTSKLFDDKSFLKNYIKSILNSISSGINSPFYQQIVGTPQNTSLIEEYTADVGEFYKTLYALYEKENITLGDIKYVDEIIIPKLIKYSLHISKEPAKFTAAINSFKALSLLLRINAVLAATNENKLFYNERLDNILTFVAQLDKLDRAETYVSIINLMRENADDVAAVIKNYVDRPNKEGEKEESNVDMENFRNIYVLFTNAIKKYTLINSSEQYVEIDVISFMNDLQEYYEKNNKSWFSLYFTLGISENFFFKDVTLPDSEEEISTVGFASEKLGVKFRLWDILIRDSVYRNTIQDDVYMDKRYPFINEVYGIIYGSGLLYSIANTTTDQNFDYPHLGLGFGVRFYNALDLNITMGLPFVEGTNFGELKFLSVGLDIPLSEYLEKLGNK